MRATVNKVVTEQGKRMYACFVDFQKAFDSVWHDGLFRKLENMGINGNLLGLIKDIYKKTECAVKINDKTTQFFNYSKGVLQGNPLSPLLFNLFINDIFQNVRNDESLITLDGVNYFNALMYADDLILMSPTPEGLQKSLDALHKYCNTWKLKINIKKTKCMTFSKGTIRKPIAFFVGGHKIDHTRNFKYLGFTITGAKCDFAPTLKDLSYKATRAIYALRSRLPFNTLPIKTMIRIFNSCIMPILTYGSEIWGPYLNLPNTKDWDKSPTEIVHM